MRLFFCLAILAVLVSAASRPKKKVPGSQILSRTAGSSGGASSPGCPPPSPTQNGPDNRDKEVGNLADPLARMRITEGPAGQHPEASKAASAATLQGTQKTKARKLRTADLSDDYFSESTSVETNRIKHMTDAQIKLFGKDLKGPPCGLDIDLSALPPERFKIVDSRLLEGFFLGKCSKNKLGDRWNHLDPRTMSHFMKKLKLLGLIHVDDIYAMKVEYQRLFFSSEEIIKAVAPEWNSSMWVPKLSSSLVLNRKQAGWINDYMPLVSSQMVQFNKKYPPIVELPGVDQYYLDKLKELREYLDNNDYLELELVKLPLESLINCALMIHGQHLFVGSYLELLARAIGWDRQDRITKIRELLLASPPLKRLAHVLGEHFEAHLSKPSLQVAPTKDCVRENCLCREVGDADRAMFGKWMVAFQEFFENLTEGTDAAQAFREDARICAIFNKCTEALDTSDLCRFRVYIRALYPVAGNNPNDRMFSGVFTRFVAANAEWAPIAMSLLNATKLVSPDILKFYITTIKDSILASAARV